MWGDNLHLDRLLTIWTS